MKNLLTTLLLTFGVGFATAQTTAPAVTVAKKQVQKTEKQAKKTETKIDKTTTAVTVKIKKDGTPDKRYKAAKNLKKDGTPDKRYKANK